MHILWPGLEVDTESNASSIEPESVDSVKCKQLTTKVFNTWKHSAQWQVLSTTFYVLYSTIPTSFLP